MENRVLIGPHRHSVISPIIVLYRQTSGSLTQQLVVDLLSFLSFETGGRLLGAQSIESGEKLPLLKEIGLTIAPAFMRSNRAFVTADKLHLSEAVDDVAACRPFDIGHMGSFVTRNALASTYSAPQRSASSGALLIGDPSVMRDRAGNFVLPQAIVMKLRDRLRNEEVAADLFLCGTKNGLTYCRIEAGQVGLRLVSKGDRWHIVTVILDAEFGEATSYVDGRYDGCHTTPWD
ncbi:hypothetical protein ZIOFF_043699 [Zingiber officinale]|uniref:Uncharacterized protein n=1 Tax=Zingiber officinale TaxID=94328 RepID=A0A8J5G0V1_ZINOF|nr:hypothetical protein ZIOFF_043699 [Zingiber officinale]